MDKYNQTKLLLAYYQLTGGRVREKIFSAPIIAEAYKNHFSQEWIDSGTDTVASRISAHFDNLKGGRGKYDTNVRQSSILLEVGYGHRGAIMYQLQIPTQNYETAVVDLFLDLIEELREAATSNQQLLITPTFCLELFDYANEGLITDGYLFSHTITDSNVFMIQQLLS